MKHHELNLCKSYDFVKQKRPCISPNLHFMGQLLALEQRLQAESPNKDSLFFETPLPMDVESIPVSVATTPQELPQSKLNQRGLSLHLPLKVSSSNVRKCPLKRKIHSASAPCSVDIATVPEVDETTPSSAKSVKTIASYNYNLMGQFYSSTDGMIYPIHQKKHVQTQSLPATPVQSPRCSSTLSCRTQINLESNLTFTKSLDISLSPCRVVSCNGGQYV